MGDVTPDIEREGWYCSKCGSVNLLTDRACDYCESGAPTVEDGRNAEMWAVYPDAPAPDMDLGREDGSLEKAREARRNVDAR